MPNTKQAKKRVRQSETHRQRNAGQRSTLRTAVKKVVNAVAAKKPELAEEGFKQAVPVIDRLATKGLIHKNKAARHKSRLNARIKKATEK